MCGQSDYSSIMATPCCCISTKRLPHCTFDSRDMYQNPSTKWQL